MNKKAQIILAAARHVFLEHGFSAATTNMIQQEAGVSKSTVYAHYANKEALFIAVIEDECAKYISLFQALKPCSEELHQMLTALAYSYIEIVLSPTALALFRVVVAESVRFPELLKKYYVTGPQRLIDMVTKHLIDADELKEVDLGGLSAEEAAGVFATLVRGEAQIRCMMDPDKRPTNAQIQHWVNTAVDTFTRAYGKAGKNHQADI